MKLDINNFPLHKETTDSDCRLLNILKFLILNLQHEADSGCLMLMLITETTSVLYLNKWNKEYFSSGCLIDHVSSALYLQLLSLSHNELKGRLYFISKNTCCLEKPHIPD